MTDEDRIRWRRETPGRYWAKEGPLTFDGEYLIRQSTAWLDWWYVVRYDRDGNWQEEVAIGKTFRHAKEIADQSARALAGSAA